MSFFGSLFGGDQGRDIENASARAKANLGTGFDQAKAALQQGQDQSLGAISSGYGSARGRLNAGYGTARTDLGAGYDAAASRATTYGDLAKNYLQPYITSGYGNQKILDDYAGVNGTGAQTDLVNSFATQNNPLVAARNAKVDADLRARFNAGGQSVGGRAMLAAGRVGAERASNDLQTYINNVNANAARGASAAGQASSLTQQTGLALADIEGQRGRGYADLSTGLARGQADLDTGEAGARAGIYGSQANNLANLTSGYYNALAGNDVNFGNATANARSQGVNNLLGLGSVIMGGFTPGKSGVSPFGNIYSGAKSLWG